MSDPLSAIKTKFTMEEILSEVTSQSDRGAAIIGGAILEELLTVALAHRLILDPVVQKRVFGTGGFCETFASKIDLALAVGLMPFDAHHDLHIIRKVRNKFAHSIDPLTFEDQQIKDWLNNLRITKGAGGPRGQYLLTMTRHASVFIVFSTYKNLRLNPAVSDPDFPAHFSHEFRDWEPRAEPGAGSD
ncbi:hypothetical protein [Pseudorhodoplanes sinuspersici]|uniref:Uncharacterized protein n=1 Tax=Pseudorhodoplanes sinuspersici TaxID=1235591 RepID=A0A1W6ZWL0_9HYPH|nr:hypothetical protein [Pseudorhodoplanes sinuspersici]ARQ01703.1 hypothetical protein CAK95_23310 [Pseudorhodoplanes sinuspersici]RKE73433.1 hypothetical protein DFP91_1320 [Pseudorhodoplanes sinuspersici]